MTQRTALIATPYFAPRTGGLEMYAERSAHALVKAGWNVVVVCGAEVKKPTRTAENGLIIWRLPIWRTASNTPINFMWPVYLRRIIKSEHPDVINAHTPVPFMVDMVTLVAGNIPVVVTYHAATLTKPASPLLAAITQIYTAFERLTLARSKHIIAVSEYVQSGLAPRLRAKSSVIYNAVTGISSQKPAGNGLVFVANLSHAHSWKGLDLILEALAACTKPLPAALHLTVIGDGDRRDHYERKAAQLGLADTVTFTGRKTGADRDAIMSQATSLITYPTTGNDAFPTVILEAWSLGLGVIASAIGPIPSLIQPGVTGLLAKPRNPAALAECLQTYAKQPEVSRNYGAAGQRLITSTYNWDVQGKKFAALMESVS